MKFLNILLICIGKLKEKYLQAACDEYLKRLKNFGKATVIELPEYRLPDNPSASQIKQGLEKEAETILAKIPPLSAVIPLCIEGKQLSSEEFAEEISSFAINGKSTVCFIIGSSCGLADEVKQIGDLKLSFSKMTFPHQLARVIALEQIYRAFSIINNSKYHK